MGNINHPFSKGDPRIPALEDEMEPAANLPMQRPIFKLDLKQLKSNGFVPPKSQAAQATDEYRRIKRPLLINAFGKGLPAVPQGRIIIITSALPGEGKTHTSINLALSMAQERNSGVILIDGDIVKADTSRVLGIKDKLGLTDLLVDPTLDLDQVLLQTDVPGMMLLSCGQKRHPGASELLSSLQMQQIMDELVERFPDRILILDGPPLLVTVEAQILAAMAGQVVMVVAAMQTSQEAVQEALEKLDRDNQVVGLILNKGEKSLDPYYYGNYYGYRS